MTERLRKAMRRLLAAPDLNLDELEEETVAAMEEAQRALDEAERLSVREPVTVTAERIRRAAR